jgi:hypothetical protein
MPTFDVVIELDEALVDIQVGLCAADVQALRLAGSPVPVPLAARALIDTGANVSCVDPRLTAPHVTAGVRPTRFVLANVPALGGLGMAALYVATLAIVHPSGNARADFVLRDHEVVERPLANLGYEALIGRDVLNQLVHFWNGPGQRLTLAY